MPEPAALRLQVTGLDGVVGKQDFQPANKTVAMKQKGPADKNSLSILLTEKDTPKVDLRLTFDVKGRVGTIDLVPYYQIPGQQEWALLRARDVAGVVNAARVMETQAKAAEAKLKDQQKEAAKKQAEAAKKALEQLAALNTLYQTINKKATVHYRVFAVADDKEVELFTTKPAAAAAPTGGKAGGDDLNLNLGDGEEGGAKKPRGKPAAKTK
jgi:hypothetical protein